MADNPLKYSDFVQPDGSIKELIAQLEKLKAEYAETLSKVKGDAATLEQSLKKVSGATTEGQQETKKAAAAAEQLANTEKKLTKAIDETTKETIRLKEQQKLQNKEAKLIAQLNNAVEGSYDQLSAQYKLNTMRLNRMSEAERTASQEGQKLEHETGLLKEQMKQMRKGAVDLDSTLISGNATYNDLVTRNKQLALEMKKVPLDDTTGKLQKMQKEYKNNSDKLKEFDSKIGNHQRNVGNYTKSIQDGLQNVASGVAIIQGPLGPIAGRITAFNSALGQLTPKLRLATKSTRNFGIALMATGIGAIVAAIVVLVKAFGSTRAGADRLTRVMVPLKAVLSAIWGVVQELATALKNDLTESIKSPGDAFRILGRIIKSQIINRVQGTLELFGVLGRMIGHLVKGEFTELVETGGEFGEAWLKGLTGVEDLTGKLTRGLADVSAAAKVGLETGKQLAELSIEIEKLQLAQIVPLARLKREYEEMYSIGQNVNLTDEERLYSIERALVLKRKATAEEQKLIDLQIKELELKQSLNDTSREELMELEELRAKKEEMLAMELRETRRINNVKNSILKKQRDDQRREEEKQNKDRIDAAVDALSLELEAFERADKYKRELAAQRLEEEYELRLSEIDILKTTEAEKTRLRLEAEKERIKAIIELNKKGLSDLNYTEIAILENQIEKINQLLETNKADRDIYDLLGFKLTDEQKEAIKTATEFALDQVEQLLEAQIEAAEKAVENAKIQTEATRGRLENEIEMQREGYAANVANARKEYELAKETQEKALKKQEEAQKRQRQLDSIMQASNMFTASTKIWSQLGFPWALPALAVMWGSFAVSKIKSAQLAKQEVQEYGDGGLEFLSGGSHASGNDISIGQTPDGRSRRAEGGEAMAIINKRQTSKYKKVLPSIIDSLNKGIFEERFMKQYDTGGLTIQAAASQGADLKKLEKEVAAIRQQGERQYYTDAKGNLVEQYKNITRRYVN